ncbi:MAG: DNA-directed RNA polymerase sigma-70 factor [Pirellulaceae bacterium]|nr:MAG: DNA-directed RNA polymerase sigma-70 factor [Pirellulaceae bacterium]
MGNTDHQGKKAAKEQASLHSTLLEQLRHGDEQAWQDFAYVFGPLIESWCVGAGLPRDSVPDIRQEVLRSVSKNIASFRRDRPGDSFRGWLWQVTRNKIRDFWRAERCRPQAVGGTQFHQELGNLADPISANSAPTSFHEERKLVGRALELVRGQVAGPTFEAFRLLVLEGLTAADVAQQLGMSTGAVYVAKSRVLKRLREVFGELWEEPE